MSEENKNQEKELTPEKKAQIEQDERDRQHHEQYKADFQDTLTAIGDAAKKEGLKAGLIITSYDNNTTISSIGGSGNDMGNAVFSVFNQYPQLKTLFMQVLIAHDAMLKEKAETMAKVATISPAIVDVTGKEIKSESKPEPKPESLTKEDVKHGDANIPNMKVVKDTSPPPSKKEE